MAGGPDIVVATAAKAGEQPRGQQELLEPTARFAQCSDADLDREIGMARQRRFAEGDTIVRQGHEGARGFYLTLEGVADVLAGGITVAHLGAGDSFGEMALLLPDTPRPADVVATAPTSTLLMTQWAFSALVDRVRPLPAPGDRLKTSTTKGRTAAEPSTRRGGPPLPPTPIETVCVLLAKYASPSV